MQRVINATDCERVGLFGQTFEFDFSFDSERGAE